jgi:hypothetical protein
MGGQSRSINVVGAQDVDALHLACAVEAKAKSMATLDVVLAKNAKLLKVKPVAI